MREKSIKIICPKINIDGLFRHSCGSRNPDFFYWFPVFTGTSLDSRFHGNDREKGLVKSSVSKS
jgi:hypothetical protein